MITAQPFQTVRAIEISVDSVKFSVGDSYFKNREQQVPCGWFRLSDFRLPAERLCNTGIEERGPEMRFEFIGTKHAFAEFPRWNDLYMVSCQHRVDEVTAHLHHIAAAIHLMRLPVPRVDYLLLSLPSNVDTATKTILREKIADGFFLGEQRVDVGVAQFVNSSLCGLVYSDTVTRTNPSSRATRLILDFGHERITWFVERGHCVNRARSGSARHCTSRAMSKALSKYLPAFAHSTVDDPLFGEVEAALCVGAPSLHFGKQTFSLSKIGPSLIRIVDRGLSAIFQDLGNSDDVVDVIVTGICARFYASRLQTMVPHFRVVTSGTTPDDTRLAGVRGMQLIGERLRERAFVGLA